MIRLDYRADSQSRPLRATARTWAEGSVSMCRFRHRELHHSGNQAAWWHDMGIDPIDVARTPWEETERKLDFEATRASNR